MEKSNDYSHNLHLDAQISRRESANEWPKYNIKERPTLRLNVMLHGSELEELSDMVDTYNDEQDELGTAFRTNISQIIRRSIHRLHIKLNYSGSYKVIGSKPLVGFQRRTILDARKESEKKIHRQN